MTAQLRSVPLAPGAVTGRPNPGGPPVGPSIPSPSHAPAGPGASRPPAPTGNDAEDLGPNSVLAKARLLLEAFEIDDTDLPLSELVRRTGLPKATAHRLCGELVGWGLLERAGNRYRLGLRLYEMGQRVSRQRILREAALPFLEDLFLATQETVHFGILDGLEVLYIEKIAGHRSVAAPSRVAGRMPLHCTATGKALLAYSSAALFEQVVAAGLQRRTPRTIINPTWLAAELARVRETGVAHEVEETKVGYLSVAAAVFGARTFVGAISLTAPTSRATLRRFEPAVRAAALGITRKVREAEQADLNA